MLNKFYVTTEGLAAAVVDQPILDNLRDVLTGKAEPITIARYVRQGYLGKEKRLGAPRIDHNQIILASTIERLREAVVASGLDLNVKPKAVEPKVTRPRKPRARPYATYALITRQTMPEIPPSVQKLYDAIKAHGQPLTMADIRQFPEMQAFSLVTLRWGIQVLRRVGLLETITPPAPQQAAA